MTSFGLCALLLVASLAVSVSAVTYPAYFTQGSCKRLTGGNKERLTNPCYGVVDYRYFLPHNVSEATLASQARTQLDVAGLTGSCASLYVSYICSSIYLKCEDAVTDLNNVATYTRNAYNGAPTYPLPFQKPCSTVCSAMATECSKGTGASILGINPFTVCQATYDYSQGNGGGVTSKFLPPAAVSAGAQCHVPKQITLASPVEKYLDTKNGMCKGLVDQFYNLPASGLNPAYASLQLPYLVQTLLNGRIESVMEPLPVWLKDECALALRQYLCYSIFPTPGVVTLGAVIDYSNTVAPGSVSLTYKTVLTTANPAALSTQLAVPRFPHYEYCTNLADKCPELVKLVPAFTLCNATTTSGDITFNRFPAKKQTVQKINLTTYHTQPSPPLPNPLTATLYVPSEPMSAGYFDSSTYSYQPDCPPGFVIPENPDNPKVRPISFSGCAIACNLPIWTTNEWYNTIHLVAQRLPVAAIIVGFIGLIFIVSKQDWANAYHVAVYAFLNIIAACAAMNTVGPHRDYNESMCFDNTTNREQDEGQGVCVGEGIVLVYCFLACCSTIWMLSIYWIFKTTKLSWIVHTKWYLFHEFIWIFVLPIIPTIYAGAYGYYGYSRTQPYCWVRNLYVPADVTAGIVGIPVLIVTCLTHVAMTAHDFYIGLCRCGHPYNPLVEHIDGSPLWEKHPNFALRFVVVFSFIVFVPYLVLEASQYRNSEKFQASFKDWTSCLFQNYDGTEESYLDICGARPADRPFVGLARFMYNSVVSSNTVIVPVYIIAYYLSNYFFPEGAPDYKPPVKNQEEKGIELVEKN